MNRTDPCCVVTVEAGTMTGVFNGTAWTFGHEFTGCAGMCFQMTACGQVEYFSDASKGAGTIKFSATTKTQ